MLCVKSFQTPLPYVKALALQSHLHNLALKSKLDIILMLQHPPTFTTGRSQVNDRQGQLLKSLGAEYFNTKRGGQTTFHGPGQLVGYPIFNIKTLGVRKYVSNLESVLIKTCQDYGIDASTTNDTGVWVGKSRKIAQIGIQVSRHITMHGFALNANVDLDWFSHIVPCITVPNFRWS